jgi:hypothetical protein
MNPVILNYYAHAMKDIVEENKLRRKREEKEKKKQKEKEKQMKMVKKGEEEKTAEKIEIKKPNHIIIKNETKPIKVEKVTGKPIIITRPMNDPIIIVKPKEIAISKEADEAQRIDISRKEKPIETQYTNTVQQTNEIEITHFKIFQEKAISQEQFTKKTTFIKNDAPNPDNPKQFERRQTLQLRKESQEYEEIEAKEVNDERKIPEEVIKAVEENEI